jgi:hypothetical protein
MNLPRLPESSFCDPSHAELIIMGMFMVVFILARMWWVEHKKNEDDHKIWSQRIEEKLDKAMISHDECQKNMPFIFVTKQEFRDLIEERNRQWSHFNERFDKLIAEIFRALSYSNQNHAGNHTGAGDERI